MLSKKALVMAAGAVGGACLAVAMLNRHLWRDRQVAALRALAKANPRRDHLVVMIHGLHGTPGTLTLTGSVLQKKLPTALVYYSTANWGWLQSFFTTSDGVDTGGKRLAEEIRAVAAQIPTLRRVSLVGLSLGGLYARYSITELEQQPGPRPLKPVNLVTIASPHTGVRHHLNWLYRLGASLGLAGRTGWQLTRSGWSERDRQLLDRMSAGKFLSALRRFERKVLYANRRFDDMVPHYAAAIVPRRDVDYLDRHASDPAGELEADGPTATSSPDFPYIQAVYSQRRRGRKPPDNVEGTAGGTEERKGAGSGSDVGSGSSGHPVEPECGMVERLRGVGDWRNVDVEFGDEGVLARMNHNRIAGIFLWKDRDSIARHMAGQMVP